MTLEQNATLIMSIFAEENALLKKHGFKRAVMSERATDIYKDQYCIRYISTGELFVSEPGERLKDFIKRIEEEGLV